MLLEIESIDEHWTAVNNHYLIISLKMLTPFLCDNINDCYNMQTLPIVWYERVGDNLVEIMPCFRGERVMHGVWQFLMAA